MSKTQLESGQTEAVDTDNVLPRRFSAAGASTYLDHIVPTVRRRLEERKRSLPEAELSAMVRPKGRRSFAAAMRAPGVSLIAEVKRTSPSKGPIRPGLEVGAVVEAYETAGARAVSVLTEQDYFSGSLDDLRTAAAHTRLPVLRKDFILDSYQVLEAHVFGASAVLLIAALLTDEDLRSLAGLARELEMDVLLEVHDELELRRALEINEVLIGINNRDLRTFTVSLDTTVRLAGSVPPGRMLVSESGIESRDDVERMALHGVDAVLVGEGILRSSDIGAAVRALVSPTLVAADRPDDRT